MAHPYDIMLIRAEAACRDMAEELHAASKHLKLLESIVDAQQTADEIIVAAKKVASDVLGAAIRDRNALTRDAETNFANSAKAAADAAKAAADAAKASAMDRGWATRTREDAKKEAALILDGARSAERKMADDYRKILDSSMEFARKQSERILMQTKKRYEDKLAIAKKKRDDLIRDNRKLRYQLNASDDTHTPLALTWP
jgi:hypothetical protein